jgi:excinuclease ABC subunit C
MPFRQRMLSPMPESRDIIRDTVARLPRAPGVYRFRDERGRVIYLGRATELRARVRSYWGDLGDRPHLARMVPQIRAVQAVECDSVHEACWLERTLLQRALPRWNRTPGGQEVEVYIGLSGTGIIVTHEPACDGQQWFGPYLGGLRVRTAVTALERLLPIGRPGGRGATGRALALARGTAVLDAEQVLTTWAAVLERDPLAVTDIRERLIQRRNRLSEALRFELAAAAHAELEAVDWVLSEQKAALLEPADAVIGGWAGGLLVRFDMRAGRIVRWTQRACDEPSGRRLVEQTPPRWRAFAARAAELAVLRPPGG